MQYQFRFMALSDARTRREVTRSSSVQQGHKSGSALLPEAPAEEDRAYPPLTGINYRPFLCRPKLPSTDLCRPGPRRPGREAALRPCL